MIGFKRTTGRTLDQQEWRDVAALLRAQLAGGPDEQLERLAERVEANIDPDGNSRRDDWLSRRRIELAAESPEPPSPGDGVAVLSQSVYSESAAEMRRRETARRT